MGDLNLIMFPCGMNTRKIQQMAEAICGASCSHASLAKPSRVAAKEMEALKDAPLKGTPTSR